MTTIMTAYNCNDMLQENKKHGMQNYANKVGNTVLVLQSQCYIIDFQAMKMLSGCRVQELMSAAKRCEGASNCHIFVVPSSVEFSTSKTRLIR